MKYTDLSKKQITKRQHYVPRAYLKNFSFDEQTIPHVYVVFQNGKEPQPVSIEKICCRTYLYDQIAVEPESGRHVLVVPNEIEESFSKLESDYAVIVSKLKADLLKKDEFVLSAEELNKLKGFMSLQSFRNPIFVHIAKCVVDRMYAQDPAYIEHIRAMLPDIPPNVTIAYLANEFLKRQLWISTLAMVETMENSQLCVFRTQDSVFITSDMPVVNIYGEERGIHYDLMGMPITPNLFVAFIDTEHDVPLVQSIDRQRVMRINRRQKRTQNILISNEKELLSFIDFSFDPMNNDEDDEEQCLQSLQADNKSVMKDYREIMNSEEIKCWK